MSLDGGFTKLKHILNIPILKAALRLMFILQSGIHFKMFVYVWNRRKVLHFFFLEFEAAGTKRKQGRFQYF